MLTELGGFAVLGVGFLAFSAVLVIGGAAVWVTARKGTTIGSKVLRGAVAALAIMLIFTWDEIAGRAYFQHLCSTQSGIHVSKQVTLGPEYQGFQFPNTPWLYEKTPLGKDYPYSLESKDDLPGPAKIYYVKRLISDPKTGAVLGTLTDYFYRGGWFENAVSLHGAGGGSCDLGEDYFRKLLEQIFVVSR